MRRYAVLTLEIQEAVQHAINRFKTQDNFCKRAGVSKHWCVTVRQTRVKYVREQQLRAALQFQRKLSPDSIEWLTRKQLQDRGIEPRIGIGRKEKLTVIDNKLYKLCAGPSHESPAWVSTDQFYRAKKGYFRSWCKSCEAHQQGTENLIGFASYAPLVLELINRLGVEEACRKIGVSQQTLWRWRKRAPIKFKRKNARKIVMALQDVRANNLVRHKDSIHHGSYLRGHKEKPAIGTRDFYRPWGDQDAEDNRRRHRGLAAISN